MTYLVIGGAFVFGVGVGVVVAAADFCSRWERERMGYVDLTHMPPALFDVTPELFSAAKATHVTVRKLP